MFYLNIEHRTVEVTLPPKTLERLRSEAESMRSQTMVGLARLRTFTGQLCWVSGVLPRIRWVVRVLYAVITHHERESRRRQQQERPRRQGQWECLVHTKRMKLALVWIAAFWREG